MPSWYPSEDFPTENSGAMTVSDAQPTASEAFIEYFETFIRILGNSLGLAESFEKLAPERRNKRIFWEVLEPIYDGMLEVHTQYLNIFNWLSGQIPISAGTDNWIHRSSRKKMSRAEALVEIKEITTDFAQKAGKFNGLRTSLRANAEVYISKFDSGSAERAFVWAVVEYFLRNDFANQAESKIVTMADMIADKGSHTIINTPASGILGQISKEDDPSVISQLVEEEKLN